MRTAVIAPPWYEASHVVSVYERGDEFDLLHDHTGPVGASVGAMSDWPTVHTLHGPFTSQARMLYRRVARRHWFVAISESQRSMAPENLRWAGVVYNGIPTDRYPFREDKDDFVCFLGRADEEKAPHLAIQAARRAGRRLVMCVTTKNQREQSYWAERVEPLLGDDVEVHGECDQDQKADLLVRAAAVLFPIQWPEPFGLVMTEAMACGTPVVAWRNGSVPEVVADGETGFIVGSAEEMAAAIGRVGELDPRAMRSRVEQRFSAEAMVTGYEGAYQRALRRERAEPLADEGPHTSRRWSRSGCCDHSTRAAAGQHPAGRDPSRPCSLASRYGRWRCRANRIPLNR